MAVTNQVNTVTTTNVVPVGAIYDADGNFVTLVGAAGTPISFSGGAGSFTTLSASSTVTFSGGTANGVAYLNGSKVLTTGSALTFDGSNLGLGVTPSAWNSGNLAIQLGPLASVNGTSTATQLSNNFYQAAAGSRYIGTGLATVYQQSSGQHLWFTAPLGTAGNAITFTQAMTLDSSGNLGIGASSVQGALNIERSSSSGTSTTIPAIILSNRNSTSGTFVAGGIFSNTYRDVSTSSYTAGVWFEKQNDFNSGAASSQGAVIFGTNGSNSGGVLPSERMRLDSSGNLLVGTTTTSATNSRSLVFDKVNGRAYVQHDTSNISGDYYHLFYYNATAIGSITQSGTTAVLYNVTSDQRLKENIVDAPEFGSVIDSIKVRSFDWITDQTHQRAGFIAQELVSVAPEAVHQPADPEEMMAVDYSKLVPMLVKEIQSLRIRIAQLEAK